MWGSNGKMPLENFYPRPPWGGRPARNHCQQRGSRFLSTPSVGRATFDQVAARRESLFLSTPSVGRATPCTRRVGACLRFLSTPSVGRATVPVLVAGCWAKFLSTPSVGRATPAGRSGSRQAGISIHALRGEGDDHRPGEKPLLVISIHALRGEGDLRLFP